MAYKITHIKTKGNESFEFYDKGAIRGIKSSFDEESITDSNGYYIKDDNGFITIKKTTYYPATKDTLGLVSVPTYIDDDEEIDNDLQLKDGKLTFRDKIKQICLGGASDGYITITNDGNAIIPKMSQTKLGVAKVNNTQSVKIDNDGNLYLKFSGGWTDITKEETEIDFNNLINEGFLTLGDNYDRT